MKSERVVVYHLTSPNVHEETHQIGLAWAVRTHCDHLPLADGNLWTHELARTVYKREFTMWWNRSNEYVHERHLAKVVKYDLLKFHPRIPSLNSSRKVQVSSQPMGDEESCILTMEHLWWMSTSLRKYNQSMFYPKTPVNWKYYKSSDSWVETDL